MNKVCEKCGGVKVKAKPRGWRCNSCYSKKRAKWYADDPRTQMLQSAKQRAKRNGMLFDLKKEDIVIPKFCPVLGIPIFAGTRKAHDNAATLDRRNTKLGYTPENVRVISYRANRIKNDASLEELKQVVEYIEGQ